MSLTNKSVAVITGAASGIGRALAIRLAQEQIAGLAISDVNESGLSETARVIAHNSNLLCTAHAANVAKADEMERLADEVVAAHGCATHLVNNAGVAVVGDFEEISLADFEWIMNINFWGTIYGVKSFLPVLKQQESAHIINVSSVFGIVAPPGEAAYSASKFAVRGFTESLRHELAGSSVAVSCVHPGGIKTNIHESSRIGANSTAEDQKAAAQQFGKLAKSTPEYAAETILRGIKQRNPQILIGSDALAISFVQRLFPRSYLRVIETIGGTRLNFKRHK